MGIPLSAFREIMDQIGLCGLTQQEASDYLRARGHAASIPAFRAWSKGAYKPPPGLTEELNALFELILTSESDVDDRGIKIPEGGLVRRDALKRQRRWRELVFSSRKRELEEDAWTDRRVDGYLSDDSE